MENCSQEENIQPITRKLNTLVEVWGIQKNIRKWSLDFLEIHLVDCQIVLGNEVRKRPEQIIIVAEER